MDDGARRQGGALGLVLVVLLALELLAHGGILLARQERAASAAGLRVLQARMAAEGGMAVASRTSLPDSLKALPRLRRISLGPATVGPHAARSAVRRLDQEVWLLEGEGQVAGESWTWRTARLTWVADPAARASEHTSPVRSRRRTRLQPPGTLVEPPYILDETPSWCAAWSRAIDSLRTHRASAPRLPPRAGVDWPSLGRLGPDGLQALLPPGTGSSGTPVPRIVGGLCIDAPWNWGDPTESDGPCADRFAVRLFPDDLELAGGVGQGVVVVMGDLRMSGTSFHGLLLVGGNASLSAGATLVGRLDVGERLSLAPDTRVTASACHVARSVHEARFWLARPVPLREVGRLEGW